MASYETPLTQEAVDYAWLGRIITIVRWVFVKVYSLDYKKVNIYTRPDPITLVDIKSDRIECRIASTQWYTFSTNAGRGANIKAMREWIELLLRLKIVPGPHTSYKGLEFMKMVVQPHRVRGSLHRFGEIRVPKISIRVRSVGSFDPQNKEEEYKFVNAMMYIWALMAHDPKLMNYLSDPIEPFADETNADRIANIIRNYKETVPHLACSFCQQMPTRRVRWKLCGKCRSVRYCSKECQLVHWGFKHGDCKADCKA